MVACFPDGRGEHDRDAVEIAGGADRRIDEDRGLGGDGVDLFAEEEAGHVEVMDGHVAENAARALDVVDAWRRPGSREMIVTISTLPMSPSLIAVLYGLEVGVEAAVEADHQGGGGFVDDARCRPLRA